MRTQGLLRPAKRLLHSQRVPGGRRCLNLPTCPQARLCSRRYPRPSQSDRRFQPDSLCCSRFSHALDCFSRTSFGGNTFSGMKVFMALPLSTCCARLLTSSAPVIVQMEIFSWTKMASPTRHSTVICMHSASGLRMLDCFPRRIRGRHSHLPDPRSFMPLRLVFCFISCFSCSSRLTRKLQSSRFFCWWLRLLSGITTRNSRPSH